MSPWPRIASRPHEDIHVAAGEIDRRGELRRRYGRRVVPVRMVVDEQAERAAMLAAAPGPIDCVLDLAPPATRRPRCGRR